MLFRSDFGKWGTLGMGYDFSYSEGVDKIDYERLKFDGRVPHAILIEMLTNEGIGTMFTR